MIIWWLCHTFDCALCKLQICFFLLCFFLFEYFFHLVINKKVQVFSILKDISSPVSIRFKVSRTEYMNILKLFHSPSVYLTKLFFPFSRFSRILWISFCSIFGNRNSFPVPPLSMIWETTSSTFETDDFLRSDLIEPRLDAIFLYDFSDILPVIPG